MSKNSLDDVKTIFWSVIIIAALAAAVIAITGGCTVRIYPPASYRFAPPLDYGTLRSQLDKFIRDADCESAIERDTTCALVDARAHYVPIDYANMIARANELRDQLAQTLWHARDDAHQLRSEVAYGFGDLPRGYSDNIRWRIAALRNEIAAAQQLNDQLLALLPQEARIAILNGRR